MFNITDEMIEDGCYTYSTLLKGQRYYKEGRVRAVDIDEVSVQAIVKGSEDYFVEVVFTPSHNLDFAECECPANHEYTGYCKHIVAVLLHLKDLKKSKVKDMNPQVADLRSTQAAGEIINYFENKLNIFSKDEVEIEITLEMMRSPMNYSQSIPTISLRIGKGKLYVVKNIKTLIESIDGGTPLEFGKKFTFDPYVHKFKEADQAIIDFLKEMYQIDQTIKGYSSYGFGSGGIFTGKYIYLTHMSAVRFLRLLENKSFKANILETEYEDVRILKEDLPVEFLLKKVDHHLLLNMSIQGHVVPITQDGAYMFSKGNVYSISKSQRDTLGPFYNTLARSGVKDIKFSEKDGEKFASLVLPNIKRAGKLAIDSSVERLFYHKPLEAKVYLDKVGDRITAGFNFEYGEYGIDPFKENVKGTDGNIIIRDFERERSILEIIEQSGFRINKSEVYLDDDVMIYDFITDRISELQKLCEIYYSESFKKIKMYDSSYYKGSVRFNEVTDLLEFSFSIEGVDRDSLPQIFASIKQRKKYYRLPDGSFLPLDSPELGNISDIIEYLDLEAEDLQRDFINLPKFKAMYLDNKLKELDSIHVERNLAFKQIVENIKEPKDMDFEMPESLQGIMRSYQSIGFKWLKTLATYGLGGILADDMGLGKTLQTIAFLLSEKEIVKQPSMVVCPTSLVYNWESEVKRFAPSLKTLVVLGTKKERAEIIDQIKEVDVVITSYPLIRRDIEQYGDISFNYCILDEAQHIKNPDSINAKSVKELRAKGYFALTGTPIENNLTELWSIFDFVMPGYLLSHRKFVEKFEKPIVTGEKKEALKELNKHVKPFVLRRLKKDVLKELPPKIESTLTAELTEGQKEAYLAYLQQIRGKIEAEIREKGFEKSHIQILAGLTRLRQICCHPAMFIEGYEGESGKMDLLIELLQEAKAGGHRVLLFSQFTEALKLIAKALERESLSYFYLDGSTKIETRGALVKAFNHGEKDVFLISLKAGGTGLNLTGADMVIHFDPWWNPAVEEQATDRAYRIGQENSVQVIKLITKGTIEEKILDLHARKKELIGSVLENSENFISKMTEKDIQELFQIS
ncbi:MAG: helicase [Anaerosolibacter sp.]|uniref:DEAD/DEAH box helicase n=1 Tax=Anaerosolibacter sp. TaxID=1872527 RepID=UPI00260A45BA|nr:DEAD/DEAH box helicase [Anaerosolibacter sp.]MDF2546203.1 helicase [Anaerosolibacter sp.]